jgi:hypothetical protein
MRRSLLPCVGLALCILAWVSPLASAQPGEPYDVSFLEVPAFARDDAATAPRAQTQPAVPLPSVSPNTGMPVLEKPGQGAAPPSPSPMLVDIALASSEYIDPRYIMNSQPDPGPTLGDRFCEAYRDQLTRLIVSDFKNFYWSENTLILGLSVAAVAPIANTHVDQGFRDWYQKQAGSSSGANNAARAISNIGAYQYVIPADIAVSAIGHLFPDNAIAAEFAQFGDRSLRALAVGAPMVGILQVGLGSDSPAPNSTNSQWRPFKSDYGASGYSFVGAIPFLTAADMTDCRPLQATLILASFATTWSRVQTDNHYLSQALLGWACAYLAVRSVNQTDEARVQIVPVEIPNGAGLGVMIRY